MHLWSPPKAHGSGNNPGNESELASQLVQYGPLSVLIVADAGSKLILEVLKVYWVAIGIHFSLL